MKFIYKAIAVCNLLFFTANAQENVYRPLKQAVYYKTNGVWELSNIYLYTYNQHGDEVTRIYKNYEEVPVSKDSLVYSESNKLVEYFNYLWDTNSNSWKPSSKELYCYNEREESCGHFQYQYENGWILKFAMVDTRTFIQPDEEEVLTRGYGLDNSKEWKDFTKYLVKYDAERNVISKTYLHIDPVSKAWTYSSRISYNGWLDIEHNIPAQSVTEEYKNTVWIVRDTSTFQEEQGLWVETRKNYNPDKSLKETLRITNSIDGKFREIMKAWGPGWLLLSSYNQTDVHSTLITNEFEEDQLLYSEKSELSYEKGKVRHQLFTYTTGDGEVLGYGEWEHELSFDKNDNLLEDIERFRNQSTSAFVDYKKTVYSDYIDIGTVTDILTQNTTQTTIYPNPGNGLFTIKNLKSVHKITVSNTSGIPVFESEAIQDRVDLSHLTPGVYLVKILNNDTVFSDKLIIE